MKQLDSRQQMVEALLRIYRDPQVQEWASRIIQERPIIWASQLEPTIEQVPPSLIQYFSNMEELATGRGLDDSSRAMAILRDTLINHPPMDSGQWGGFLRAVSIAMSESSDVEELLRTLWAVGLDWLPQMPELPPEEWEGVEDDE